MRKAQTMLGGMFGRASECIGVWTMLLVGKPKNDRRCGTPCHEFGCGVDGFLRDADRQRLHL
jgi:hypothetical protein